MKNASKLLLSTEIFFRILYYLSIAILLVVFIAGIAGMQNVKFINQFITADVDFVVEKVDIKHPDNSVQTQNFYGERGKLKIKDKGSMYYASWVSGMLSILIFIFISRAFWKLSRSLKTGDVFTISNLKRLQLAAVLFLMMNLLNIISRGIIYDIFSENYEVLSDNFHVIMVLKMDITALFPLFVIIVAEAFKLGIRIREENELTI